MPIVGGSLGGRHEVRDERGGAYPGVKRAGVLTLEWLARASGLLCVKDTRSPCRRIDVGVARAVTAAARNHFRQGIRRSHTEHIEAGRPPAPKFWKRPLAEVRKRAAWWIRVLAVAALSRAGTLRPSQLKFVMSVAPALRFIHSCCVPGVSCATSAVAHSPRLRLEHCDQTLGGWREIRPGAINDGHAAGKRKFLYPQLHQWISTAFLPQQLSRDETQVI